MTTSGTNTALLIIDMQNDAMNMVPSGAEIQPTIKRVLEYSRTNNIPVIHIVRVHRADGVDVERFRSVLFQEKPFLVEGTVGAEIVPELKPITGECIIKKTRFSGFFQTNLQLIISRLGVSTLVICGVQTPNCIRETATDALAYDYAVVLLKDAISAQTREIHEANLFDMQNMGITITTVDAYISSWNQGDQAGNGKP